LADTLIFGLSAKFSIAILADFLLLDFLIAMARISSIIAANNM